MAKSELEQLISDIKKNTNQIAINKVDEVKVMKSMLNDKNFSIGVYDRNIGYIGQKCPHNDAVKFVKGVIAGATGLDNKDAQLLAENYEFSNRDANFLLENMRDFLYVYTNTGRKINIMQSANTEACLYTKEVNSSIKQIPDKDNPGKTRSIETKGYTKLVSTNKSPKYTD
jgi:hypothetical protein